MITSEAITKNELIAALEDAELAAKLSEKITSNLETNRKDTIEVAESVAMHIFEDLDRFLDMHSQM